jgi:hypothetical protein
MELFPSPMDKRGESLRHRQATQRSDALIAQTRLRSDALVDSIHSHGGHLQCRKRVQKHSGMEAISMSLAYPISTGMVPLRELFRSTRELREPMLANIAGGMVPAAE